MGRLPAFFDTLLAILDILPPRGSSWGVDVESGIGFAVLPHGHVLTLRHRHCYNWLVCWFVKGLRDCNLTTLHHFIQLYHLYFINCFLEFELSFFFYCSFFRPRL
jgi:hypothetical protein